MTFRRLVARGRTNTGKTALKIRAKLTPLWPFFVAVVIVCDVESFDSFLRHFGNGKGSLKALKGNCVSIFTTREGLPLGRVQSDHE
jgi:hypothetical protein